jgi:uncharacterized membrane protein
MSAWATVLLACGLAYLTKLAGYLVPAHWLSGRRISRVTALLPVALLTGLVVVQAFATADHGLTLDARAAGVAVAVVALLLRAPFIVVVVLAAATAAALRHLGWG